MNSAKELKQQEKYKSMLKRKNKEKKIYKDKNSSLRIEKMNLIKCVERKDKEIERLNNIINELEKYCNDEINEGNKVLEKLSNLYNSSDTESFIKGQQAKCEHILDKLQELKGSDK